MKRLIYLVLSIILILFLYSCNRDDYHQDYKIIRGDVKSIQVMPYNNGGTI
jgi:hypothetical protein